MVQWLAMLIIGVGLAVQQPAASPEEVRPYEAFRLWITQQPVEIQRADDAVVFEKYGGELRKQGKSDPRSARC